jgi:hypothetical protein
MKCFAPVIVLLVVTGTPSAQERVGNARAARRQPAPNIEFRNHTYGGTVTDITKTSITIEAPESKMTIFRFTPDGKPMGTPQEVVIPAQPPKLFHASETLANGKYAKDGVTRGTHLLTDVKKGDKVTIQHSRVNGVDICESVRIFRRPGGKVPPAAGDEKLANNQRWDTQRNGEQFIEEKVIPGFLPKLPQMVPRLHP